MESGRQNKRTENMDTPATGSRAMSTAVQMRAIFLYLIRA